MSRLIYPSIERGVLHQLYVEEGLSSQIIAARLGVPAHVVVRDLRSYRIPRRSKSEAASLRRHSDETKQKMSATRKGRTSGSKGHKWTQERHRKHKELWSTPEFRAKVIPKRSGDKSPLWRGGTSDPSNVHLARSDWIEIRNKCYIRDDGRCQSCGVKCLSRTEAKQRGLTARRIQAHHIVGRRDGGSDDLSNLVTLCVSCHHKIEHRARQGS